MSKLLTAVSCAALVSLMSVTAASAQKLADPTTSGSPYKLSGRLYLYQSIPDVWCQVNADVNVNSSGVGTASNIVFSGGSLGVCGTLVVPNGTWQIRGVNVATQKIEMDVNVTAAGGTCVGTLSSSATDYLYISGTNIVAPGATPSAVPIPWGAKVAGFPTDCYVNGELAVIKPSSLGNLRVVP